MHGITTVGTSLNRGGFLIEDGITTVGTSLNRGGL